MTAVFDPDALDRLLHADPRAVLAALLQTTAPDAHPRIDIICATFMGFAGPTWDTHRERYLLKLELAVPTLTPDRMEGSPAACNTSALSPDAISSPAARTGSAPQGTASSSTPPPSLRSGIVSAPAASVVRTAASSSRRRR